MLGRHLLSIADLDAADIHSILDLAAAAKSGASVGRPLEGRSLALVFQRPSNRTRVSFEVAVRRLGGHAISLQNSEIQIGERESVADVARILDRYVDGIVARLISHRDLLRMAQAARGPVVNAMTDREHPCQLLADLLTVHEATGRIAGATVAYVGDGNNVCASWLYGAAITGVRLSMVCPPGYEPPPDVLERAATLRTGEATFTLTHDPRVALRDAEIVYTDVWTSMGQEQEQQRRREDFAHLQVNDALVALATPGARVMHCLPAHRGEEITDSVIDGPSSIVFDQAENRMWVQLALLARIFGVEGLPGAGAGATGEARVGAAS